MKIKKKRKPEGGSRRRTAVAPKKSNMQITPAFIGANVERTKEDYLLKATETQALQMARIVTAAAVGTARRGRMELEMAANTWEGGRGKGPDKIPLYSEKSIKKRSGMNGTFNAKTHKIRMVAGDPPSKAMNRLSKDNGELKMRILRTQNDVKSGVARQELTVAHGFNQKNVIYIHPDYFGFEYLDIKNEVLKDYLADMTTWSNKMQRAYAAVTRLRSKMTITNNNSILPMNVTLKLIKQKSVNDRAQDIGANVINTSSTIQEVAKMAILYQLRGIILSNNMTFTAVDPQTSNIHSSMNALAAYEIVKSKTIKLAAGDQLEFTYDHLLKSGIDMTKLYSAIIGTEVEDNSFYTYGLIVETWGPNVEALQLDGQTTPEPVIPVERYNGTGPAQYSFEFEKYAIGARSSAQASSDGTGGFAPGPFALRVFTPMTYEQSTPAAPQEWNYAQINAPNGFKVPLITDTEVRSAESKK